MNDFGIMILGYCIQFFGLITLIRFQCPIPNVPCSFQRFCIGNFAWSNCLNKVSSSSRCVNALCGMNPTPHVRIPMMPNKILKVKHTNKGCLTYSICCAWAWSSSHSNSTFFFIQLRALFSFRFCLACKLFKIQMFITR
jgi:hypothetical protein